MKQQTTIDLLLAQNFPLLMSFDDIAKAAGIKTKTLINWQHLGTLPIPTRKYGGARKARLQDVAAWIDQGGGGRPIRRGRPTATEAYRKSQEQKRI